MMKLRMLMKRHSREWLRKDAQWQFCSVKNCLIFLWSSSLIVNFIFTDDNNDKRSAKVLAELENIDDECDQLGIAFVKIDNADEAKEYGIEKMPKLLYFEKGIPTIYEGNLEKEEEVLRWMELQTSSDEIEDVTDEMLDLIISKMHHVAVLFCEYSEKFSPIQ